MSLSASCVKTTVVPPAGASAASRQVPTAEDAPRRTSTSTPSSPPSRYWSIRSSPGKPLVVGRQLPTGAASWRRRATRRAAFGIRSAMSCAEARRRCPEAVFVRADHRRLPRVLSARSGRWFGRVVPGRRAVGHRRGLPRSAAADGAPRGDARGGGAEPRCASATSLSCSLGVATSQGRRQGGLATGASQAGSRSSAPGGEAAFLAPLAVRAAARASGPKAEERLDAAGSRRSGASPSWTTPSSRLLPGSVGQRPPRSRARDRPATGERRASESISIGHEETFDGDVATAQQLHAELRADGRGPWRAARARGRGARAP